MTLSGGLAERTWSIIMILIISIIISSSSSSGIIIIINVLIIIISSSSSIMMMTITRSASGRSLGFRVIRVTILVLGLLYTYDIDY